MVFAIGIAAFAATLLGGLLALRLSDRMHLVLGFSAGSVIGVAFFDLLPEALTLSDQPASLVTALAALGFALYMVLDRMVVLHRHHDDHGHGHAHSARGVFGAGSLSFHSFLDGVGIGLAFQVSSAVGFVVAFAVLAHDFSDGINTVSVILKNGGDVRKARMWLVIDALAPFFGVLSTLFISIQASTLGLFLALFCGFFLYIGSSELLPEAHHSHPVRFTTLATLAGMVTMFAVIQLAGL